MIFSRDKSDAKINVSSYNKNQMADQQREHVHFSLKNAIEIEDEGEQVIIPQKGGSLTNPDLREYNSVSQVKNTKETAVPHAEAQYGGEIKSALAHGTVIEGKFQFKEPVRIDGSLTGEISSNSTLIVGENARLDASISVGSLIVHGEVFGSVQANDLVSIKCSGILEADLSAKRLIVEDGAQLVGGCRVTLKDSDQEEEVYNNRE